MVLVARVVPKKEVVRRRTPLESEEHVDLEVATEAAQVGAGALGEH